MLELKIYLIIGIIISISFITTVILKYSHNPIVFMFRKKPLNVILVGMFLSLFWIFVFVRIFAQRNIK